MSQKFIKYGEFEKKLIKIVKDIVQKTLIQQALSRMAHVTTQDVLFLRSVY